MFKKEEMPRSQGSLSRNAAEPDSAPESRSDTSGSREGAIIGRSIHITGDLLGEEDLRIEGDVSGTIQLKNNSLTIGKEGKIKADIYAKAITVDGLTEGDIYGAERVTIRKNARVLGNITAPRVSLEDGARFKGSIEMDPQAVEAALGKPQTIAKPMPASGTGTPPLASKPAVVSNVKN
ncbi:MAG TPA: polymer-forming cytoskeletal protein [Gammaproteobacteria bacterium]